MDRAEALAMLSPDNIYRDIVEGGFKGDDDHRDTPTHQRPPAALTESEVERSRRRRLRRQAAAILPSDAVDSLAEKLAKRRPGGQPGNKNRVTHGRKSRAVRDAKRMLKTLGEAIGPQDQGSAWGFSEAQRQAVRWSSADRACLEIAVLKKAELLRWRLQVIDALEAHQPAPEPPPLMFTPREIGLYRIFIEQQRILGESVHASTEDSGPERHGNRLVRIVDRAAHDLGEWRVARTILSPAAQETVNIDVPAVDARLRHLARRLGHSTLRPFDRSTLPPFESFDSSRALALPPPSGEDQKASFSPDDAPPL